MFVFAILLMQLLLFFQQFLVVFLFLFLHLIFKFFILHLIAVLSVHSFMLSLYLSVACSLKLSTYEAVRGPNYVGLKLQVLSCQFLNQFSVGVPFEVLLFVVATFSVVVFALL